MTARYLCLAVLTALAVGWVQATHRYMMPQRVLPIHTNPAPLLRNLTSGDVKLEEVQKKGNLIKWEQTINGIPVYGSVITTRSNQNGKIDQLQGFVGTSKGLSSVDPTPDIPSEEALDLLKIHWNHTQLREVNYVHLESKQNILQTEEGDKLVWKSSYYINWKDDVKPLPGFVVPAYIIGLVNAHNGAIEKTWNGLNSLKIPGIVGNDKIGSSTVMMDVSVEDDEKWCRHRNDKNRVEVFTLANKRYLSPKLTKSTFVCDRANTKEWDLHASTGGFSPRNELFTYGNNFVTLWKDLVGNEIQPYRTNDSDLTFYAHYDVEDPNAFFNGYSFVFGDGDKKNLFPLTALDIVCHEIGHAMTEWRGGSMEYRDESGAMNEAYSDMLGATCNMYYKKRKDFLIGASITRPGKGKPEAARDMCNPKRFGGLDHYKQYQPRTDVHHSSGIYNKAFCTLAKTKHWNYIKAFQLFTDANLMFWNPTTTMHCGACGVESAAKAKNLNIADIQKAFDVVGVSCNLCPKI